MNTAITKEKSSDSSYQYMDYLTRQWWFYLFLILIIFLPPLTPNGFSSLDQLVEVVTHVSSFVIAKRLVLTPYMPQFHLAFILLLGLLLFRNKFGSFFSIAAGFHFLLIAYLQAGAASDKFGLVLYPNAITSFSLVSVCWFWEAKVRRTDYSAMRKNPNYFWMAGIVAVFSFWNPDQIGYLSPKSLVMSTSPIAFCMISPIYLSVLSLLPQVNQALFRILSFVSIEVGLITIGMGFFKENRVEGVYWSLLHIPMLIVSVYCLLLGFRDKKRSDPD